jgi:hypothetical protein
MRTVVSISSEGYQGLRPPFVCVRDHHVRAISDEAARVAGTHSTGTAHDNHCPVIETPHDGFSFLVFGS